MGVLRKPKILFYDIDEQYKMSVYEDGLVDIFSFTNHSKGKRLSLWLNGGYLQTKIHSKNRMVHHLVAEATYGIRPEGLVTNHIDGNKLNNHPANLEYCTINDNIQHSIKMGMHVANDPKRNGRYIDGRTVDKAAYKHQHYLDNIEIYKARGKAFYQKTLEESNHGSN